MSDENAIEKPADYDHPTIDSMTPSYPLTLEEFKEIHDRISVLQSSYRLLHEKIFGE